MVVPNIFGKMDPDNQPGPKAVDDATAKAIDAVLGSFGKAYEKKNLDAAMSFLSKNFPGGGSQLKDQMSADFDRVDFSSATFPDGQDGLVQPDGSVALKGSVEILAHRRDGNTQDLKFDAEIDFVNEKGAWKIRSFSTQMFGLVSAAAAAPAPPVVNVGEAVNKALKALAQAYNAGDLSAFMDLVSKDYPGGRSTLKSAVKTDFNNAKSLNLSLGPGSPSVRDNSALVPVSFQLNATRSDGSVQVVSANVSFELVQKGGVWLLRSMTQDVFGQVTAAAPPSPDVIAGKIRDALNALADAYNNRRRSAFMKLISDNFKGDSSALEDQIVQDFNAYPSASLAFTPETPSINNSKASVQVHYALNVATRLGGRRNFSDVVPFDLALEDDGKVRVLRIGGKIFGQTAAEDLEAAAEDTLNRLAQAYSNKSRAAFLRLVSDDFLGNTETFEDALVKDFRNYSSVNLQLIYDRVLANGKLITVDFHYNMQVVNANSNNQTFSGSSEFIFRWEGGVAKLYKMELPLIFGNSLSAAENPIGGSTGVSPVQSGQAPGAANQAPSVTAVRGSAQISDPQTTSFKFKTQSVVGCFNGPHDFCVGNQVPRIVADNKVLDIGACSLSTLAVIPAATQQSAAIVVGDCYAFLTTEGQYAVIKVTAYSTPGTSTVMAFDYAYQSNGTNRLQ